MTYSTKVLPAVVVLALACGCGCCGLQQDCLDPDDPCSNGVVAGAGIGSGWEDIES